MIELPEAVTLAAQFNQSVQGKRIADAVAGHSPHKFAWFNGDPGAYGALLRGRTVGRSVSHGAFVSVGAGDARLLLAEGLKLRLHAPDDARPKKHQLLVEFDDGYGLSASVQMYGGLWAGLEDELDNRYFEAARTAPSPLTDEFDDSYFRGLLRSPDVRKLSTKAFLATEQRIPGLGNGVLQDILFEARLHPRRKVVDLGEEAEDRLMRAVTATLTEMTRLGGRDTERDLYGEPGGYRTILSRNTVGTPCPRCGSPIEKAQYLGGSVYYCGACQVP